MRHQKTRSLGLTSALASKAVVVVGALAGSRRMVFRKQSLGCEVWSDFLAVAAVN